MINQGKLYPVADGEKLPSGYSRKGARLRATGEKRAPRQGEWFLSGAVVEGYRALTDLTTEYYIGVLIDGEFSWQERGN